MAITDTRGDSIQDTEFVRGFCRTTLPGLLARAGLTDSEAHSVVVDVIRRARMLAALPSEYADVLATPFLEEVSQHRPLSAPAWLRAAVVVAVRNSKLEDFHAHGGPIGAAGIADITEAATGPLRSLLEQPGKPVTSNTLADLDTAYPRAWACLTALSNVTEAPAGREDSYVLPQASRPALPGAEEMFHAPPSSVRPVGDGQSVVASGTDPRFDQALIYLLRQVKSQPGFVVPLSALSRLSRDSGKQLRVLEFLLAHQATVVTTNYLLGPGIVGVRARPMVKPDSYDLRRSMKQTRGLGPTHTKLLKTLKRDHF
ncbi:hypothetical protein ACFWBF_34340 [Streptomyces sp. NPDC060028]|uniref:hypothetical protein n=1 Tax=Streptomyces sp. NPDC060028 TaxID=3347041 RepID=UPI00369BE84A